MKCYYCQNETDRLTIDWKKLKGYPMCDECHKDTDRKTRYFNYVYVLLQIADIDSDRD